MPGTDFDFAIGSKTWPGLSKVNEECGELIQVIGKLMATGGAVEHWDGTNLRERLLEEMADVQAAIWFVGARNDFTSEELTALDDRTNEKLRLFYQWHDEQYEVAK